MIQCRQCNLQYVGQTSTTLRTRLKHHANKFNGRPGPRPLLYRHFDKHGWANVNITPVKHCPRVDLLREEAALIQTLQTTIPHGLNSKFMNRWRQTLTPTLSPTLTLSLTIAHWNGTYTSWHLLWCSSCDDSGFKWRGAKGSVDNSSKDGPFPAPALVRYMSCHDFYRTWGSMCIRRTAQKMGLCPAMTFIERMCMRTAQKMGLCPAMTFIEREAICIYGEQLKRWAYVLPWLL